ncbi:FKBP-type peptidyl-prolyl cis-trans isomerase [Saprospiraceae bacterium]|nr:FKBP-type peptidyl-prolyl cis-trans isomerase [Saprospiraceae bacterium]
MDSKSQLQILIFCLFMFFSSLVIAQDLTNRVDSVSYSLGLMLGNNIKKDGIKEVNQEIVAKAIEDVMQDDGDYKITRQAAKIYYTNYMTALKKDKTKAARADGEAYLLKNATKKGVITTASGLQYEVMKKGDGPMPTAKDKVEVHYHGTLIDGTVFDSSVDRGKTISFPVMGVIKGWQEALQLMHVGDKLKLTIPQSLAYGKRGAGANIPPYSTLVFEVELFGIQ